MALADIATSSVWPSGDARTTNSVPILALAPGRFSITNGCTRRSESHWPSKRATISGEPPAGTVTTT